METNTYELVKKQADSLMSKAALGELPTYSMLFNFGATCNIMNFVYPLMIRYYLAGKTVTPFLTGLDLCKLRYLSESSSKETHLGITYTDLLDRDICVLYLDSGCTEIAFYAAKGLLSLRALKQKTTILITNNYNVLLSQLETPPYMENCKHLATPYFVKYIDTNENIKVTSNSTYKSSTSRYQQGKSEFEDLLGKN